MMFSAGVLPRVYPAHELDLQLQNGAIPIASCGVIRFAGATNPEDYARVTVIDIPYPTASGGTELLPVASPCRTVSSDFRFSDKSRLPLLLFQPFVAAA